jgi:CubicO group peptidase (beta-lactamase class C family)
MKTTGLFKISLIAIAIMYLESNTITYAQNLDIKIDSLLSTVFKENGPGIVFLVAKNGKPIYRKAFGKANLELNVDMQPNNVFQIGSMTKQFTAMSILMLMEEGKLKLDDDITLFIPDYPTGGKSLTIHHLLTHTSGVKDYTRMKSIMEIAKKNLSPRELVDFFMNEPIEFSPGEKFEYNNSGYVILGYIVELASGETYEDFVEKRIFQKIDMNDSRYANDREVIKNRAYGYHNRGEFTNKMIISLDIPYASGALMSTVDGMLKWQEAINDNVLVKQSTINKAFTKYTLNNGNQLTYGYGWHLKEIDGIPTREHGGSIFGYKSMGVYVPSKDIYVIGFSNCDCNSPTKVTRDIAQLVLQNK